MTDFIDEKNNTHWNANITSRNHPDYVVQGWIKTSINKIDYTAFLTADRREYTIINSCLFDLDVGRIILIVPSSEKNGILYSRQIKIPIISSKEVEHEILRILNDPNIVDFYSQQH